jgi:hypothetical protein
VKPEEEITESSPDKKDLYVIENLLNVCFTEWCVNDHYINKMKGKLQKMGENKINYIEDWTITGFELSGPPFKI